jgi:hypothetical protein
MLSNINYNTITGYRVRDREEAREKREGGEGKRREAGPCHPTAVSHQRSRFRKF